MGLFGNDDSFDVARDRVHKDINDLNQIGLPQYQVYSPQMYTGESANYSLIQNDARTRELQLRNLEELAGLSHSGMNDIDKASYAKALGEANQNARANTGAIYQNAAARGASGSGMEFALKEIANQSANDRAAAANTQQAADSARQRALYQTAYGSALSGMRDQDARTAAANTDIINRFNQANTNMRNSISTANTNANNNAFLYNEGLKDRNYNNQLSRNDRNSGLGRQLDEINYKENERRNQQGRAIGGMAGGLAGAYFGGPAGAAAGYQVGSGIGGGF